MGCRRLGNEGRDLAEEILPALLNEGGNPGRGLAQCTTGWFVHLLPVTELHESWKALLWRQHSLPVTSSSAVMLPCCIVAGCLSAY